MIWASAYIIVCSARNRLRVRLRRLREPRYLLGAIVGAVYMYFAVFSRFRTNRARSVRRRTRGAAMPAAFTALAASGPTLAGLVLLILTALAWLIPVDSGLLEFSEAETQFLFPAPMTRRSLLIYRMLRSQLGLLFGAVIVSIATPSVAGYTRLRIAIGMWLLMCTGKIYFTGISLARARLGARNPHERRVAWAPFVAMTIVLIIVGRALMGVLLASPSGNVGDILQRLPGISTTGAASVVLWPFIALARPLFAPWPGPYLLALAGSATVLAASVAWVLKSDEAFHDAAEQAAARKEKRSETRAAAYRARGSGWPLAPTGRPEMALAWKAAIQTLRVVDKATMVRAIAALGILVAAAASFGQRNGFSAALAVFAVAGSGFAILLGPQAIRIDMRQDLQHLELLKTWPIPSAAVVRGQLLWPGALISVMAWLMIVTALLFSSAIFPRVSLTLRMGVGGAALLLAPALAFAQLAIHNGAALMFPAWVPLGPQRARGLDAMGQRMIMLGGTWLTLLVMMLPGVVVGGIVWFAFRAFTGAFALIPAAAICAAILAVEVLLVTEALGPAYDRLDLLAVERSE